MKNPVLETSLEADVRMKDNDSNETSSILDLIVDAKSPSAASFEGLLVGKLAGFDDAGRPLVSFVCDVPYERVLARSTIALKADQVGSDVAVVFERGDLRQPIIIGSLWQPESSLPQEPVVAELDGQRIALTAKQEIVLRCGNASITLTQAGKVLIRGAYLSSHSSGVNRIKGGSVQIN
jgi:hypothetical protein